MNIPTQSLLPNETILKSTFNILYKQSNATAFLVNGQKGQFLITAKHLFKDILSSGSSVKVNIKGGQINMDLICPVFFHCNQLVDIAVMKLKSNIICGDILPLKGNSSFFVGQECLFLGFPLFNLGSFTSIGKVAFVKKAIVSALYEENNTRILLLDGQNNPGFSGGPVITYSETMTKLFIIGVISGYIKQTKDLEIVNEGINNKIQTDENSGIIISYEANYISEIIHGIENN